LGALENYASKILKNIRQDAIDKPDGITVAPSMRGDDLLRFCAAILWKYSITKNDFGRIQLGSYQELLRQVAFQNIDIPESFDAAMFRLRLSKSDDSVFAYRAPSPDRKYGVNFYRLFLGGVLFLIRLDRRMIKNDELKSLWLREAKQVRYNILPAQYFEEFKKAQEHITSNPKLSRFLGKQE